MSNIQIIITILFSFIGILCSEFLVIPRLKKCSWWPGNGNMVASSCVFVGCLVVIISGYIHFKNYFLQWLC